LDKLTSAFATILALQNNCNAPLAATIFAPTMAFHGQQPKKHKNIIEGVGRHLTTSRSRSCPQRHYIWRKSLFLCPAWEGTLQGGLLTCKTKPNDL
jgi:hypothetical protein